MAPARKKTRPASKSFAKTPAKKASKSGSTLKTSIKSSTKPAAKVPAKKMTKAPARLIEKAKNSTKSASMKKTASINTKLITKEKKKLAHQKIDKQPKKSQIFQEVQVDPRDDPFFSMHCPVPPWTATSIQELAKYIDVSGSELAKLIGLPYSTVRNWISGKARIQNSKSFALLQKFEKKIKKLRADAEVEFEKRANEEIHRKILLKEAWPVERIRELISRMALTQPEFAVFAGVSYDTVVSWCQGRRNLRRKDMSAYFEKIEEIIEKKGYPAENVASSLNSSGMQINDPTPAARLEEIPDNGVGEFLVHTVESVPGKIKLAKKNNTIVIKSDKKIGYKITIEIGTKSYNFNGIKVLQRDRKMIEIVSPESKYPFGKVGCIGLFKKSIVVNFWPTSDLPYRIVARIPKD
ncbi:MAG: hypothetical protein HQM10_23735 [Candidatus Riflebacteria bacterium]|nr:hypothetical protein [Candidatus Riflebacteria bacterium]